VGNERAAQRRGSCDGAGLLWDSSWPAKTKRRPAAGVMFWIGAAAALKSKISVHSEAAAGAHRAGALFL
jgi:hypothetical protein